MSRSRRLGVGTPRAAGSFWRLPGTPSPQPSPPGRGGPRAGCGTSREAWTAWTFPSALLAAGALLALAGCAPSGGGALLRDVQTADPPLSPALSTARGATRLDVSYVLARPARVSARLEAGDGRRWVIYEGAERPLAGAYRLSLDGTVPGPGPNERRVLPDGEYQVVLRAEADGGPGEEARTLLRVRDADTTPPAIEDLTTFPERISPNFDARDDVMAIAYRVSKAGRAVVFADQVLPDGTRKRAWTGEERTVEAGQQRLQWDGTRNGRPLPDSAYELGVRATDAAGNVSEARRPIALEAGGTPDAKLVFARVAPREIIRGNQVCLEVVVRNTGTTTLRTQGPDPSYVYDAFDTYSSIEDHRYVEQAGYWRVGLDAAGSGSTVGARYPWRWGFGRDLAPGDEAPVRGCVRLGQEQTRLVLFGALIQENVAIRDAGAGMVEVRLSP